MPHLLVRLFCARGGANLLRLHSGRAPIPYNNSRKLILTVPKPKPLSAERGFTLLLGARSYFRTNRLEWERRAIGFLTPIVHNDSNNTRMVTKGNGKMASVQLMDYKTVLYEDVMDFINGDVCSFFMKRLSAYHLPTFQHSVRVALYSMTIADRIGIRPSERFVFLRSVLLHDIGKLSIPKHVLDKKGTLTSEEWSTIGKHTVLGTELLTDFIEKGWVDADTVLYHHENMDGTGYFGVKEKDLSSFVRILRVTDSYDAMTGVRGYRLAKSGEEALEELYRWSGVAYDSEIVSCFHASLSITGKGEL